MDMSDERIDATLSFLYAWPVGGRPFFNQSKLRPLKVSRPGFSFLLIIVIITYMLYLIDYSFLLKMLVVL